MSGPLTPSERFAEAQDKYLEVPPEPELTREEEEDLVDYFKERAWEMSRGN